MIKYEGDGQVVSQKYHGLIQTSNKQIFVDVVAHSIKFLSFGFGVVLSRSHLVAMDHRYLKLVQEIFGEA